MVRMVRLVLCALVLYQTTVLASQPEVVLQQGALKGLWAHSAGGRTYAAFYGIPYAKPPQGKNRFKEPVAADPWLGVYNATKEPPKCLQLSFSFMNPPSTLEGSEDCLYLNVFTPRLDTTAADQKPLDVIAFIHGGAFMVGSSTDQGFEKVLDRDIVLVSFNYRLGPLGFFSTGDEAVPGNNGMKDQVLALKWIQQNIAAFGGDPNSVTLAGLSAGAASVHYHVLSPLSKGLFKGAICASGSPLNPWAFAENVREKSFFVAKELGCPAEDSLSMIKCLRRRPADHIVDTSKYFLAWFYNPFSPYGLVVEPPGPNAFLPDSPMNLLKQAKGSDVPIMVTFAKDEGLFPAAAIIIDPQLRNKLKADWNRLLPHLFDYNYTVPCEKRRDEVSQEIRNYYNIDLDSKEGQKNLIRASSDRLFINGIAKAARLHSEINTSPVYLLRFSYSGNYSLASFFGIPDNLGVSHGENLFYILSIKGVDIQWTEADQQVSKQLIDQWISFAANGTLDAQTVNQNLPKITFTDYQGPDQLVPMMVDEMGEEKFWDSLNLKENIESIVPAHREL
ncbi:esterase FE4 [Halyomorpha halys]|uniref:esterase FE4 n=1 Tax=Halyomorpha halys TaxID=286706 RepID=UPI0006D50BE3|nr:esterase FE4-like [Halyomorpha halys]